jgi:hypothetical protein
MSQRGTGFLTAGLTGFCLALLAGTIYYLTQAGTPTAPAPVPTKPLAAGFDRAAYDQALSDARARLTEANQRLAAADERAAQAAATAAAAASAPAPLPSATATVDPYAVDAAGAARIALQAAPGAGLLAIPELVLYNNAPAFEARLDRGVVYVAAISGAVLYNGAAAPALAPAAPQAPAAGREESEDDD